MIYRMTGRRASDSKVGRIVAGSWAPGKISPYLSDREVVYAAGGDGTIYRFADTLEPDQRIVVESAR